MATTKTSLSQRIRGLQRIMRDARLGTPMTPEAIKNAETIAAECASEVERMEIAAGGASVPVQLRAAGGDVSAIKRILAGANSAKAVRRG